MLSHVEVQCEGMIRVDKIKTKILSVKTACSMLRQSFA